MEDWEQKLREEQKHQVDFVVDMMVNNERNRREKERDAERRKIQPNARLARPEDIAVVPMTAAATPIPSVPPVYYRYALALTAAVEYLANNNYATAKVPVGDLGVTPQHLRNTLRTVRNFMMANPPLNYPIDQLTFVDVSDGVVVRDKRKSEPFKITVPVSKPSAGGSVMLPYPMVATPELIAALGVVLRAVDQSGAFIEWPNFGIAIVEPENVMSYNDLMRRSFPPHWTVGLAGLSEVEITRKVT